MNREQAKEILLLYRPGQRAPDSPEMAEALELAERDHELGRWFEEHRQFQQAMRDKLRQIAPPPQLKEMLLARPRIVPLPARRFVPAWLAAAAAIVLLLALYPLRPRPNPPDRFADYAAMMVSKATLQYGMEFKTNDLAQLARLIAAKGGPEAYSIPPSLQKLPLTGGGTLRWRSNPVAMVCFDKGSNNMVFLFVMKRTAVKDPPPDKPRIAKINSMLTASWTSGDKTYVLAGPEEADFEKKYF